jgi:hypothetical protein
MARRGDTKPLCHVAHASVGCRGGSIAHISGDKALVLCQGQWTTCESGTQVGRTSGGLTFTSSRSVWKAEGGVYERKEASEKHVPWEAISPATDQRYATPPLDVTRDNVCSMARSWCHRNQRPCRLIPRAA